MSNYFNEKFETVKKALIGVDKIDYLFLGDSWLEFWTKSELMGGATSTFYDEVKLYGLNAINIGVGGTEFKHWLGKINEFIYACNPKKIVICLGGNDLANGTSVEDTYKNFTAFMDEIHTKLPNTKVYLSAILHCKFTKAIWHLEDEFNEKIKNYAKNNAFFTCLALEHLVFKDGKLLDNIDEYFLDDNIHLTQKGYDLWGKAVLEEIQK